MEPSILRQRTAIFAFSESMNFVTKGTEVNSDLIKGPAASGC